MTITNRPSCTHSCQHGKWYRKYRLKSPSLHCSGVSSGPFISTNYALNVSNATEPTLQWNVSLRECRYKLVYVVATPKPDVANTVNMLKLPYTNAYLFLLRKELETACMLEWLMGHETETVLTALS